MKVLSRRARTMRRNGWLLGGCCVALLTGCVERRFVVTSDPPGAVVLVDNAPIGATPADAHFTYYGTRQITLVKDGYQTLKVQQELKTPWYEYIGLDFFTENVYPLHIEDVRRFHYTLEPLQAVRSDQLLQDAEALKERGRAIEPLHPVNKPSDQAQPPLQKHWWSRSTPQTDQYPANGPVTQTPPEPKKHWWSRSTPKLEVPSPDGAAVQPPPAPPVPMGPPPGGPTLQPPRIGG